MYAFCDCLEFRGCKARHASTNCTITAAALLCPNACRIKGVECAPQLLEVRVLESLPRRHAVVRVIDKQTLHEVDAVCAAVWQQLGDAGALFGREVEVYLCGALRELCQEVWGGCTEDVVDFLNLVNLVGAWKEGEQGNDFKKDAAHAPHVHLVGVVAIGQQALRGTVPACAASAGTTKTRPVCMQQSDN